MEFGASGLLGLITSAVKPVVLISAAASLILGINQKQANVADRLRTLATEHGVTDPTSAPSVIPKGACVLTDQVSFTIAADRFVSSVPGCPQIVDGDGTDLDLSRGRNGVTGAARTPAVRAVWYDAFRRAQYVWLSSGLHGVQTRRIAWTPWLRNYFEQNFQRIPGHGRIYKRIGPPGA